MFRYVGLEKSLYERLENLEFEKNEKANLKKEEKTDKTKVQDKKYFFESIKIRKTNFYEILFILFSIVLMCLSIASVMSGFNSKALIDGVNISKNFTDFRTNLIQYNNSDIVNLLENFYNKSFFLNYSPLRISLYTVNPEDSCDENDMELIKSLNKLNYYCSPKIKYNHKSKFYTDIIDSNADKSK